MHATDKAIALQSAAAKSTNGGAAAAAAAEPPPTIWWHQADDGDEDYGADIQDVAAWVVMQDLVKARSQLMHSRGAGGTSALEKLKVDFLYFARDAYLG
mmetsp:Transcript_5479/g.11836  ORF Transcript_5479/g.11836 Transcript_5479/m.11836 type:complete len:99 (+) Transcript_5479:142-438(+)